MVGVVPPNFRERRDLEQYFWTAATVRRLVTATQPTAGGPACLAAPTLAVAWHAGGAGEPRRDVPTLDIDTRFSFLPGFRYWDMTAPLPPVGEPDPCRTAVAGNGDSGTDGTDGRCRVLVVDPPFFTVSLPQLVASILHLTTVPGGLRRPKLLIGYLRREAGPLLAALRGAFPGLRRTAFNLEYAHIKPNKWQNYSLYADVDLPGVRRLPRD